MRTFSRDPIDRIGMGCVSVVFLILFGPIGLGLVPLPAQQVDFWTNVVFAVLEEVFFVLSIALLLALVWSIATPSWVERLFQWIWGKLYWSIAIFALVALCVS